MTPARKGGSTGGKAKGRARRESSAGGVVLLTDPMNESRNAEGWTPRFLLIRDTYGKWGFPKGHVERGERAATAALREVMEEAGVRSLRLIGAIRTIEWYFRFKGSLIHKSCQYFLMETAVDKTNPQVSEGISECRWATVDEARELISYDNAREVLQQAYETVLARRVTTAGADAH
jgi:8-oxo-dGTP pyrophosphatase MutT (NUDIX family)